MVEARVGQLDFGWLSKLPEQYRARRNESIQKEILADVDPEDSGSLETAARKLIQANQVQLGVKLGEMAKWREQQRMQQERLKTLSGLDSDEPTVPSSTGVAPVGLLVPQQSSTPVGGTPLPAPPQRPVMPTSKVWGTDEGVAAGLYDPVKPQQVAQAPAQAPVQAQVTSAPQAFDEGSPKSAQELALEKRIGRLIKGYNVAQTPVEQAALKAQIERHETQRKSLADQRAELRKSQLAEDVDIRKEERATKAKSYTTLRDQEKSAQTSLNITRSMEAIAEDSLITGGSVAPFVRRVGQALGGLNAVANSYGIPMLDFSKIEGEAGKIEAFNSLHQQLVRAQFTTLGSGVSNRDTSIVSEIFAGIRNTPEGVKKMLLLQRRTNERTVEATREVRNFRAKNPKATQEQEDEYMAGWAEKKELLSEADLKVLKGKPKETPAKAGGTKPVGRPKPGDIIDGYRYKGGDLNDRNSYEPAT